MTKQLIELTEREIAKVVAIGRPKIINVEWPDVDSTYRDKLHEIMILREIKGRSPRSANAFLRGKREDLDAGGPDFSYAVQYYKVNQGERK